MTSQAQEASSRAILNVGGNSKTIGIPEYYTGWIHDLLDIDPAVHPDILCDARELDKLSSGKYDAVYCSHNLEHFYPHDVPKVLRGFLHVLKDGGFAEIIVPDIASVIRHAVHHNMDVDDVLYESEGGPITIHDVLYGWHLPIERSGKDYFAHKRGFTPKSLRIAILNSGFSGVWVSASEFNIRAIAFRNNPSESHIRMLGLA